MKVEFFHDVICSFCYPMSYRVRKLTEKYPKLEVIHRSFALGWDEEQFIQMFGSHQAVKPEVMSHWVNANQNDELSRFNIEGMKEKDFLFPISKHALTAAKAAGILGGQNIYWEIFDALQHSLFVENRDVANIKVIEEIVRTTSIDFDDWKDIFEKESTEKATLDDITLAQQYGLQGVPALVIEGRYLISGAQPQEVIEQTLESIAKDENFQLT